MLKLATAFLMVLLSSCGMHSLSSQTQGHFEDSSNQDLLAYANQVTVPPEYAPTRAVIMSLEALRSYNMEALVKEVLDAGADQILMMVPRGYNQSLQNSSDFRKLRSILSSSQLAQITLSPQVKSGINTVWARDWAPVGALWENPANALSAKQPLLDFNYRRNERPSDDNTPSSLAQNLNSFERISIPVYNDGGNFMVNDRRACMMTTRITDDNSQSFHPQDLRLDADQIRSYFKNYAACASVEIFPRIPYEFTGHIDMWAKYLNDDTILVSEIEDQTLNFLSGGNRSKAKNLQDYLKQRQADLKAMGYTVISVPMPAPQFSNFGGGDIFRSYTNSLFVNDTVIVPRYAGNYSDSQLQSYYEGKATTAYQQAGFKVRFVTSDSVIAHGGAIHCITTQIPKL